MGTATVNQLRGIGIENNETKEENLVSGPKQDLCKWLRQAIPHVKDHARYLEAASGSHTSSTSKSSTG